MNKIYFVFFALFSLQFCFGQQTVGLFLNDPSAYNGYTLFAPKNGTITYLIDNCGFVVHTWEASENKPGETVYLLENGNLLKAGRISSTFNGAGTGGGLEIFNWEGDLVWSYDFAGMDFHQHHDIAPLPNGNILLLAWDRRTNAEAIEAGRNPNLSSVEIWSEQIVEIKPLGTDDAEIVWEWKLWDHLVQDYDEDQNNFGVVAEHPELLNINFGSGNQDWLHLNSMDYNSSYDQILICSRHLNEIFVIDHSTTTDEAAVHSGGNSGKGGDILFRWGNPQTYDRGELEDQKLFGPHDARWIPQGLPDENKIMIFNNGHNRPEGNFSTVEVIDPPIQLDQTYSISQISSFEPSNFFWKYESNPSTDFFSSNMSSAQRLPNGNTLILEGQKGNIFEITTEEEIVWNYKMPISFNGPVSQGMNTISPNLFRAIRYGTDYPAFFGKDLTPGEPIELNPLPSDCEIFEQTNSSKNDLKLSGVEILKNPIEDFLLIKNKTGEEIFIEIFDLMGSKIVTKKSSTNKIQISSSSWNTGIYVIKILDKKRRHYFLKKIFKY